MNSLFGVDLPTPVNFVIAFVVVLALIGAATWLVRRFGVTRLDAAARGRQPRLAVIDAAAVDGRRKLVIVRRDNVEHLLMIGGPTDVVVETNIVRAATATTREAPAVRANGGAETQPRAAPLPDPTPWPLQPEPAPAHASAPPAHAGRAERAPRIVADDPSRWDAPIDPPARTPIRASDAFAGVAPENSRPATEPTPKPRVMASESAVQSAAAGASQGTPATDHSLAEMAQRLEAALRRPAPMQRIASDGGTARVAIAASDAKPAAAPTRETRVALIQSKGSAQPKPQSPPQQSANLEQEMANLLGRPRENVTQRRFAACVRHVTVVAIAILLTVPAHAQDISINFGQGAGVTERVIQLIALLTVLSLAPSILVMMTSFTRIVVVLSLLRTALGTATAPPNAVIVSLALFLTAFVMGPAFQRAYDVGVKPLMANEVTAEVAFERSAGPFKEFMLKNVREKDLKLFNDLAKEPLPAKPEDLSLRILIPAFMISELKRAFEIGFLLFLPFLIIDLVVASVLMSMGMMMLPPVVVSLPFKLIFFVLVDGWSLVAGSLVQSYGGG